jgi:hypothetical protein
MYIEMGINTHVISKWKCNTHVISKWECNTHVKSQREGRREMLSCVYIELAPKTLMLYYFLNSGDRI